MAQQLKVLHFVTGGFSGATRVVVDIIVGQQTDKNIESLLVLRQKKTTTADKLADLQEKNINYQVITGSSHWATIRQLRQIIEQFQPDVLLAHGFPEHLIGRWAGKNRVPVLLQVEHGSKERYNWWRLWQTRYLSQFTTTAIGVSQGVADVLNQQRLNCPIMTISNGVHIQQYLNHTPLHQRPKDVVMVARFAKGKNHQIVLEAIAQLKQQNQLVNVTFVGTGSRRHQNYAKQLANNLGIAEQVTFLGQRSDVAEILAEHKIFVLASFYEGLSLSVIEAMSAGCVVMGSDVVGVRELINQQKDGFLFDNQHTQTLANQLSDVLKNPQNYQNMVMLAQQKAEQLYDISVMADNYRQLFYRLTKTQS